MDLEQRVKHLQDRIDLMKTCYMKGFGNIIVGIKINSYSYLKDRDEADKNLVLEELEMVEKHYATIPFDELDSNEDFAPLFVVRELLKLYSMRVRKLLEEPEEDKFGEIKSIQTAIGYTGEVYRGNFNRRLNELRIIPGYETFQLDIVDYKGAHFVM